MAGPAVFLNFKRMRVEAHVQSGYVYITTPSVDMVGTFESGNYHILVRLNRESLGSFGRGTGVSLCLPVSGPLYFHLLGDFLATKAELSNVAGMCRLAHTPRSPPVDEKRFVGVANVGAGLGISFRQNGYRKGWIFFASANQCFELYESHYAKTTCQTKAEVLNSAVLGIFVFCGIINPQPIL